MVAGTEAASAYVYTDIQGLSGLRRQAQQKAPEATREAAKQFEALFIQMMLKSMRATVTTMESGLMESDQSQMYLEMFDQQIALSLAQQGKMGIADLITQQLGEAPEPPTSPPPMLGDPLAATLREIHNIRQKVAMPATAAAIPGITERTPRQEQHSAQKSASEEYPISDAPFKPGSPAAFVRRMWPHAQEAAQQLGVAPEALIAQAAHETGWGRSLPRFADGRTSHNLFGIKADRSWQGDRVVNSTSEVFGGVTVRQKDGFRAYGSYAESFSDYVRFLKRNPRYTEALTLVKDSAAYLRALQRAGYATDPGYARKIQSLMNGPIFDDALTPLKSAQIAPMIQKG